VAKIVVDYDTETKGHTVIGVTSAGEFPISGPWSSQEKAEEHAKLLIGLFNEAANEIIAESKRRIILA
jgi:hypothetical protein